MKLQYLNRGGNCQPGWKFLVDNLLDELLPRSCLLCGGSCSEHNLCPGCLRDLPRNLDACAACGLPRSDRVRDLCGTCLLRPPSWDRLYAPLRYEFPVDVLVRMLKYHRKLAAGPALAGAMMISLPTEPLAPPIAFVPVPLHWTRLAVRGYNQAQELARHLSKSLGQPMARGRLQRTRRTRSQTGLDAAARHRNLREAFRWTGPGLDGSGVVLIDDVLTTGSTAAACTRALRKAGAGRVDVWVAARAPAPG